jgi:hypothetical protein
MHESIDNQLSSRPRLKAELNAGRPISQITSLAG